MKVESRARARSATRRAVCGVTRRRARPRVIRAIAYRRPRRRPRPADAGRKPKYTRSVLPVRHAVRPFRGPGEDGVVPRGMTGPRNRYGVLVTDRCHENIIKVYHDSRHALDHHLTYYTATKWRFHTMLIVIQLAHPVMLHHVECQIPDCYAVCSMHRERSSSRPDRLRACY